jgi:ketosteroid isomerase-like protein
MSENLDLVRSINAAWERGDFGSIDWAHPEIEFVAVDGPVPGRWNGVAGMREAWREYITAWDDYRMVIDGLRELGGERVLTLFRRSGRGERSGLEIDDMRSEGANVFDLHDGKVTRIVRYWDRERALADLGLKE